LFVVVVGANAGAVRIARIDAPAPLQEYMVPGVPAGDEYSIVAFVDRDADGAIGVHDATVYRERQLPLLDVPTAATYEVETFEVGTTAPMYVPPTLPQLVGTRAADGATTIEYSHQPWLKKGGSTGLPVRVTLRAGRDVVTPIELPFAQMSAFTSDFMTSIKSSGGIPGDAAGGYRYEVAFSDGRSSTIDVAGPPAAPPLPFVDAPGPTGPVVPELRWRYPQPLPAGTRVTLRVYRERAHGVRPIWTYSVPEGTTTVAYDADGRATAALAAGTEHTWELWLEGPDTPGGQARSIFRASYTPE
jgi:hypothetical protein